VSQAVGERVLLPAIRSVSDDTIIVADGFSCREQILQATGRPAVHLAEAIQLGLTGDRGTRQPGRHRGRHADLNLFKKPS